MARFEGLARTLLGLVIGATLASAMPARATDIYIIPMRGLVPDKVWPRSAPATLRGRYLGYGYRTVGMDGSIEFFRLDVDGSAEPVSIMLAYPLKYFADGASLTLTCDANAAARATSHSCDGVIDRGALKSAETLEVQVQSIQVPGEKAPVLVAVSICVLSTKRPEICGQGLKIGSGV